MFQKMSRDMVQSIKDYYLNYSSLLYCLDENIDARANIYNFNYLVQIKKPDFQLNIDFKLWWHFPI